ncbi:Peroxisomal membrane 22 kDa (Mpv17/PMP22) family protein [Trifolium repens]|nr:Peroxisomal membrane 22 kDa (Mpv17/PMP22) family protein [Trifolium repens]
MDAIGFGNGFCGFWKWNPSSDSRRRRIRSNSTSPGSVVGGGYQFPVKQALTAASLALTGDTIAQVSNRWSKAKESGENGSQDVLSKLLSEHDLLRALRMTSYGFLFYGPGSYAWYQLLDHYLPKPNVQNLMLKVLLNQIVLGPCVIAVVFAWNNLWQQKLSELPEKYKRDAIPTLLYGFRFWIPVSVLNFWVVPLPARVAFMSMDSTSNLHRLNFIQRD